MAHICDLKRLRSAHLAVDRRAEAYYVYVGTTTGALDLVNSGELHQTSYTVRVNHPGSRVQIRLWTKLAGVWRCTDYGYDLY